MREENKEMGKADPCVAFILLHFLLFFFLLPTISLSPLQPFVGREPGLAVEREKGLLKKKF